MIMITDIKEKYSVLNYLDKEYDLIAHEHTSTNIIICKMTKEDYFVFKLKYGKKIITERELFDG